ncbi:MAG: DUF929 family protein [Candidatus Micrarchaeota archaeon]|nr:DUF929 family protein [Candidatus Micrarchaeota archaeon]
MKKEYLIYIIVGVIVVIGIAAYVLLRSSGCSACGKQVSGSYIQGMYNIANNYTLADNIGTGAIVPGPQANLPKHVNATPLTSNGKPEILYVGGDYCPYCAITRWGLILALMRFGNFTSLNYMESTSRDIYPNTATFSFSGYGYSSSLVSFDAFELYDRNEQNITSVNFTQKDQFLLARYSGGGIPFIDFANSTVQSGSVISPQIIQGEDWSQVLADLSNQNSVVAQEIIGNANIFTAYICASNQTLNSTAYACKQPYVRKVLG